MVEEHLTLSAALDQLAELDRYNKWIFDQFSDVLGPRVLEVGSGTGNITAFLCAGKREVLATDVVPAYRRQLERFHGREIKTTGDGFLMVFDSAEAALLCALAIRDVIHDLGIEIRTGVHTGEVEVVSDDIRGIAVHAAARIMAAAQPSEVLASAVTRYLAEGTGLDFEDRGAQALKGIETPLQLFAVQRQRRSTE